jgi:pimeloyl-ACP methyl ester carboxylesterase
MQTTTFTHDTVPTEFVESNGVRWAYRRFGTPGKTPFVFVQHFRGNMDNHDSAITDPLSADREVILFDNRGVASTSGTARETVDDMARDMGIFIDALGLPKVILLGHSMGGEVAQELAMQRPELVSAAIFVGTGPRGGRGMQQMKESTAVFFTKPFDPPDEMWVPIMFSPSSKGVTAGRAFLQRIRARRDRDVPVSPEAAAAHRGAAGIWGRWDSGHYDQLKRIVCPTLVVNGSHDIVIETINSFILQQNIPDAKLVLYPDSGHGSHYEYHGDFVAQVRLFLAEHDV